MSDLLSLHVFPRHSLNVNVNVCSFVNVRCQLMTKDTSKYIFARGTQRQFLENICSEDDLRSRIFGTFVVKFLAVPLLGFSKI